MSDTDFAALIEPIARHFWGEPPKAFVTRVGIRWGNSGSKSVDLQKGTWFDHKAGEGGGVLDLVMQETGSDKAGALDWLRTEGFIEARPERVERREEPPAHEPLPEQERPPEEPGEWVPVKGYDYTDRDGNTVYQVLRLQKKLPDGSWAIDPKTGNAKKTFRQRRKDAAGNVIWNLEGVGHTIYRHPQVEIAIDEGKPVFLPEGEKDVETFEGWGLTASTNSGGAQHWSPQLASYFKDADVIIPVDNDKVGIEAGEAKAKSLKGIAKRIRVLNFAEHVPDFPNKGDVTDWRDHMGGDASKLDEILKRIPDWKPRPPRSKFGGKMVHEIASTPIAYDWLVKGLIERGGVFVVAGEQQAGKSFFVIDLGMKIARGLDYCGRKVRQGLVIHHAGEDYRGVQMRVEGYRRDAGVAAEGLLYLVTGEGEQKLNLMNDESVDAFIAECQEWQSYFDMKLELVTIDTLSAGAEDLDEINGAEVGKVLGRINRISSTLKTAVAVVHHLNAGGQRVRGSTKFTANVAQVIEVRQMTKFQTNRGMPPEVIKDSDGRVVRQAILEKNKNGPNKIKWRFVLRQVQLDQDADGFQMTTCVCDPPSSEVAEGDPREKLSRDQRLVLDALKAAVEDEGMPMPSGVRVGSQIKLATTEKAFAAAVRKVWPFKADETEHEARKKELTDAMKRNVTALLNAGYIGRDNDKGIVWDLKKDSRPRRETKPADPPPPLPADVRAELPVEGVPF